MAYSYPFKTTDEQTILTVWANGRIIPDKSGERWEPTEWRWDICGKPMKYSEHGNTNSDWGWEIDHIKPTALDGSDDLENLQPLQWENNRKKGDTYPWTCP